MATLKAVIGANYGDEGKGHMVDYFAYRSAKPCIVVCTNGGAQRGHTVCTHEDGQHIFHHFGSGTFTGACTYLPKNFIANPMIFAEEYKELAKYKPRLFMHPECLVSTPFDMMVNQIIEESRGENKHGSCGVGIWETILRNEITACELFAMTNESIYNYLVGVRDTYFAHRLKSKGIEVPKHWKDIFFSEALIRHYIKDIRFMELHSQFAGYKFLRIYDSIIFENGQGLLLDQNQFDSEHTTPSNTGSQDIRTILAELTEDTDTTFDNLPIEICYVTRSYLTRHGAGHLKNEAPFSEFHLDVGTETNVWNKNQGMFRYGNLDVSEITERCRQDFVACWGDNPNAIMTYAVTHMDEVSADMSFVKGHKFYLSLGPHRSQISDHDKYHKGCSM